MPTTEQSICAPSQCSLHYTRGPDSSLKPARENPLLGVFLVLATFLSTKFSVWGGGWRIREGWYLQIITIIISFLSLPWPSLASFFWQPLLRPLALPPNAQKPAAQAWGSHGGRQRNSHSCPVWKTVWEERGG